MRKLFLLVILSVFISTIVSFGPVNQASAQDITKPQILWSLTTEKMKQYNLEPRDIVGVRMNENCTRIFIVQHGYHLPCRLLIFDVASGKLVGGANIEARDVPTFVPNADGTKVFIVTDYGTGAMELNVNTGKNQKSLGKRNRKDSDSCCLSVFITVLTANSGQEVITSIQQVKLPVIILLLLIPHNREKQKSRKK